STVPTTLTWSPTAGSATPVNADASMVTPRITNVAGARTTLETSPSSSTLAPAVCTTSRLRNSAVVAMKVVAGSAGSTAENADTTWPTLKAPAHGVAARLAKQVAPDRSTARPPIVAVVPASAVTTPSALNPAPLVAVGRSRTETSVA